ncbi:hypothetical protein ACE6H2_007127 [Prunus campanulata]
MRLHRNHKCADDGHEYKSNDECIDYHRYRNKLKRWCAIEVLKKGRHIWMSVVLLQLMTSRMLTRLEIDINNLEGNGPIATFEYLEAIHDNPRNLVAIRY